MHEESGPPERPSREADLVRLGHVGSKPCHSSAGHRAVGTIRGAFDPKPIVSPFFGCPGKREPQRGAGAGALFSTGSIYQEWPYFPKLAYDPGAFVPLTPYPPRG